MNLTITTSAIDTAPIQGAAPVLPSGEQAALLLQPGADALLDPAAALAFAQLPVLQFGQWLDQAAVVEAPAEGALDAATPDTAAIPGDLAQPVAEQLSASEQLLAVDMPLLNAMAMPLLPTAQAAQATLAAVAAALPGAAVLAKAEPVAAASAAQADGARISLPSHEGDAARFELLSQPANTPVTGQTAAAQAPAQPGAAPAALPRTDLAIQDGAAAGAKPQAQAVASAPFAAAMTEAAREQPAGAERTVAAGAPITAPAGQNTSAPADTVTLSGPPTAWRQNLREALGERLQLQVGRSSEQAVIRLDPPNLGQVEIAIRHSAGTLEVTISATHRDVVRQLQAVSENLRSDLAQRQFTDVAVNVAPARPTGQAAPFFGGDSGGRGRQQDDQQDGQDRAAPGQALAEAHHGSGIFSLNARD